jgi:hypothetical protein
VQDRVVPRTEPLVMEAASQTTTANRSRWFHPTPARLLIVLLVVEAVLLPSERWFPKGYAVLTAIAVVGATMLLMLVWWLAALCFPWRFQFSLRSLLVLTVVVAIPFSWLAVEMKRAREQREVAKGILKFGVGFGYDYQLPRLSNAQAPPPAPDWLRSLLGNDFFANIAGVILVGRQVTDRDVEPLKELTQLQQLCLERTQVTDAGLEHLKSLTGLQSLCLIHMQVTDAGVEHLKGLSSLRLLVLEDTNVTDKGVKELQQALPNCKIQR